MKQLEPTHKEPWWNAMANVPAMVWVVIVLLLIARVVWQIVSPYTLIEDEAHYWEWSRRLDWSYYSKGPGVAWIIWVSTSILGHTEYAIRIPAAAAAAAGTWAVAKMTKEHFEDQRLVFVSAILYACVPGFAVAAMVMTIDSPYIASWAWASLFALRAVLKGDKSSWVYFGIWIAIGFIFKYTILLLLPGVLLALFVSRASRPKVNIKWLISGLMVSLIGLVPVLVWNANHDWATVRHLLGHLGAPGGDTEQTAAYHADSWTILWMLEYVGLQMAVGGPVVFLSIFAWLNARKHATKETQLVITTMIAMGLPILAFYFVVSLATQTEGNWAMGGFVTLIPAAAWAVLDGVGRVDHPVKFAWGAAVFMGVAVFLVFPGGTWLSNRSIVGPLIPLYRMTGMVDHAKDAQRVIDELRESTGLEPLVMSEHYGRASLLAFYLDGQPTVYCTSAQVGGRKTQYDMWEQTDLNNPQTIDAMLGRPGILFGGRRDQWSCAFDQLMDIGKLINEPKEKNTTYTGLNFHTFDSWTAPARNDTPVAP
ncbi:MAG: glycosyltransferase family 39 protein [Phycisphaerales bacterium]|nr:glycosyltransferase family 39 protein [Phycisphaerales bacterium]